MSPPNRRQRASELERLSVAVRNFPNFQRDITKISSQRLGLRGSRHYFTRNKGIYTPGIYTRMTRPELEKSDSESGITPKLSAASKYLRSSIQVPRERELWSRKSSQKSLKALARNGSALSDDEFVRSTIGDVKFVSFKKRYSEKPRTKKKPTSNKQKANNISKSRNKKLKRLYTRFGKDKKVRMTEAGSRMTITSADDALLVAKFLSVIKTPNLTTPTSLIPCSELLRQNNSYLVLGPLNNGTADVKLLSSPILSAPTPVKINVYSRDPETHTEKNNQLDVKTQTVREQVPEKQDYSIFKALSGCIIV